MYWPLPLTASEFIWGSCPERAGNEVNGHDPEDTVDSADAALSDFGSALAKGGSGESSTLP